MVMTKEQCNYYTGTCGEAAGDQREHLINDHRVEIYVFTDPLCPLCWGIEPKLKKLLNEYNQYIKVRYVVMPENASARIHEQNQRTLSDLWDITSTQTGMCCDGDFWYENPISVPETPSIAIKAAEMQGRQCGMRFLRRVREALFLNKQDVTDDHVLLKCAQEAGLDEIEFQKDFHSDLAKQALESDLRTKNEMGVSEVPSMIFFNDCIEDAGVMISGLHSYDVYEDILTEVLGKTPVPEMKHDLLSFVRHYSLVATAEIAEVFDLTTKETKSAMKRLQLQQKVECVPVKHGEFWKYNCRTEE
ncbi:YjbH-like, GTP pyrophosphokinase domain [Geomicrobium sp. JCM 19038]|nr:YjbH-like, GTP pyrophosphokinase domain [Geomicrobium sp. JCM 19038]